MVPKRKKAAAPNSRSKLPIPITTDSCPPWEAIPGHEVLLRWASDIRNAIEQKDDADWILTGRMAMVVTSPQSWGLQGLVRTALELKVPVRSVSAADLIKLPPIGAWKEKTPSMLLVEPGDWMAMDFGDEATSESVALSNAVVEWITRSLDTAPADCGVVLGCVADAVVNCPAALRQPGLLDRFLELSMETLESRGARLIEEIGPGMLGRSIKAHPARFAREFFAEYDDERRQAMAILQMRRHSARTAKPFEFVDLVRLSLQGFAETTGGRIEHEIERRSTAYHEAGHAVMAIIDSSGENTPDIASIVPTRRYQGVVVHSASYHMALGDSLTYREFRHQIRVTLAGRAAEELAMGAECISNGCASDLDTASGTTLAALTFWGFMPGMDEAAHTGSNLLVHLSADDERFHEAEAQHLFDLGRAFLDKEYQHTLSVLKKNRNLLDRVAEALLEHLTLDQEMLAETMRIPA